MLNSLHSCTASVWRWAISMHILHVSLRVSHAMTRMHWAWQSRKREYRASDNDPHLHMNKRMERMTVAYTARLARGQMMMDANKHRRMLAFECLLACRLHHAANITHVAGISGQDAAQVIETCDHGHEEPPGHVDV